MSYTVFKYANNHLITAPNESGEIILKSSIPRQIRIEVNRNTYQFYDIIKKEYLSLSEIKSLDPKMCHFTAIIYPCSSASDPEVDITLVANEDNYPIVYKLVNSCLGAALSLSYINSYNGKYYSDNIYFTNKNNSITINIEFNIEGNKIGLNLYPSGEDDTTELVFGSDYVEILSLFQHNITIDTSYHYTLNSTTQAKDIYSFTFSFINHRYGQYVTSQISSILQDLPRNTTYPASGLYYKGRYSNGASTMSITVYTIRHIYINAAGNRISVSTLLTDKTSGSSSSTTVDATTLNIAPNSMDTLTLNDDVTQVS